MRPQHAPHVQSVEIEVLRLALLITLAVISITILLPAMLALAAAAT